VSTEAPKGDRFAWMALLVVCLVAVSGFFFVIRPNKMPRTI